MRVLDTDSEAVRFDGLGLSAEDKGTFESLLGRPHGMILLTGPTGSGKTTTLYAVMRDCLDATTRNIITIEDPVEYRLPGSTRSRCRRLRA